MLHTSTTLTLMPIYQNSKKYSLHDIDFSLKNMYMFLRVVNHKYHNVEQVIKFLNVSNKKLAVTLLKFCHHQLNDQEIKTEDYSNYKFHMFAGTGRRHNKTIKASRGSSYRTTSRTCNVWSYVYNIRKITQ